MLDRARQKLWATYRATQAPRRETELSQWLAQRPWKASSPPAEVLDYPSMLLPEERQLLFLLGRELRGEGAIVDAGCFLGGSTCALAHGLAANPRWNPDDRRVIHSYDLFALDAGTKAAYPALVEDLEVGASLRATFDQLIGTVSDYVNVHEGDITDVAWTGGPVEVLFIDVAKTWDTNDHVMRQFFPSLIPYRSVVVQQDFVHEWLPHIPVAMGLLDDAFAFAGFASPSSALYVPTRQIDPEELPVSLQTDIADRDKLACFDRACVPFAEQPEELAILGCARAVLLQEQLGRHAEAMALLDGLATQLSERVANSTHQTRSWLLRSHPDPAVSAAAWDQWHAENGG
jgi:hypothetical protein